MKPTLLIPGIEAIKIPKWLFVQMRNQNSVFDLLIKTQVLKSNKKKKLCIK